LRQPSGTTDATGGDTFARDRPAGAKCTCNVGGRTLSSDRCARRTENCVHCGVGFFLIFYFLQYALRSAPGVMIPELTTAFGLTTLGISSLLGLYYYTYASFAIVAGPSAYIPTNLCTDANYVPFQDAACAGRVTFQGIPCGRRTCCTWLIPKASAVPNSSLSW
jgi:hypothetical protein